MALSWDTLMAEAAATERAASAFRPAELATRFVQPPFSVLDTRKGDWQERRRAWLSLGIRSELGRGALVIDEDGARDRSAPGGSLLPAMSGQKDADGHFARGRTKAYEPARGGLLGLAPAEAARARWSGEEAPTEEEQGGTSIFDPVLCELAYRWFAPEGGSILDPFAGGSVRGIVAAMLGHRYTGIDLSGAQLEANRKQAAAILGAQMPYPTWLRGDSRNLASILPAGEEYDMVWTCPPYFDLEVYSNDPEDLSAMDWPTFIDAYQEIIAAACLRLRRGRFAAIVVSEVRDKLGAYRGLVPLTIHAFRLAGLSFYNDAVLVNSVGSLPLRVGKYMEASRKLGRAHQNVLVFLKGDAPRGWSYDRAAPPSPQLDLALLPADDPAPTPPALPSAAAAAPEAVLSGGQEGSVAHEASVAGTVVTLDVADDETDALLAEAWAPPELARTDDDYLVDPSTGEVIEAPPAAGEATFAFAADIPPVVWDGLYRCEDHAAGYHPTSLEASACIAGTWWAGWPSVIPSGPPGSGAGSAPPDRATLWPTSDEEGPNGD